MGSCSCSVVATCGSRDVPLSSGGMTLTRHLVNVGALLLHNESARGFYAQAYNIWLLCTGEAVPEQLKEAVSGAAAAIWTTTGWTIPANQAVAVNERLTYAIVEAEVRHAIPG